MSRVQFTVVTDLSISAINILQFPFSRLTTLGATGSGPSFLGSFGLRLSPLSTLP